MSGEAAIGIAIVCAFLGWVVFFLIAANERRAAE
jgi:hypothetical protein